MIYITRNCVRVIKFGGAQAVFPRPADGGHSRKN